MDYVQKQCILKFFRCYDGPVDGIWGRGSQEGTKRLQSRCGLEADGIFGTGTEARVRALIGSGASALPGKGDSGNEKQDTWWQEIRYFSPEEFRCQCRNKGKPSCDGWPHALQPLLVQLADRARAHFDQPITVISGLRCPEHNQAVGGVADSQHMYGEAADIYVWNTDPDRVLQWFRNQPEVRYAYRIPGSSNIHFDIPKALR